MNRARPHVSQVRIVMGLPAGQQALFGYQVELDRRDSAPDDSPGFSKQMVRE
jgi:hypothetical protein